MDGEVGKIAETDRVFVCQRDALRDVLPVASLAVILQLVQDDYRIVVACERIRNVEVLSI